MTRRVALVGILLVSATASAQYFMPDGRKPWVAPERRYALLDLFFRRQESWSRAQDPFAALGQIAGLAGMADGEIQACLKNEAVERAVLDQRLTAEKAFRINATPSFVIGGATHSGGMSSTNC